MLKNYDIIYMAGHDYNLSDCKISTDHIAYQLSKYNRVLFVESIGLRKPQLNRNDLSRIGRKIKRFFQLFRKINNNFYVCTPLSIPGHQNAFVQKLNEILLVIFLRTISVVLRIRKPILIVFLPSMSGVIGKVGEILSAYYCTDEHSEFPGVDREAIRRMERSMLEKVDLGFATSLQILEKKKKINPGFYLSIHGVDYDHFSRAQDSHLKVPNEIMHLRRPVIGYFGAIDKWMDLELIDFLIRQKREWTYLFIGKTVVDIARFVNEPNIHFIGQRPFSELPGYGKLFDVAIIPFVTNELTRYVFPIKLKEYLSMGKPVVSSAIPPVEKFSLENPGVIQVGYNHGDFLKKIELSISSDSNELIRIRQQTVNKDTWEARAEEIGAIIENHLN
jgi:glycosyltransferase involved in cell wall biosynthesis